MSNGVGWLSDSEQSAWRALMLTVQLLDESLDRQLLRDANMPHTYYGILVALSEAPGESLRMSELAGRLHYSPSRMTHAIKSLERKGWTQRGQCPTDGRGQVAQLTEDGRSALADAAPGHVAEVRKRVFDRLTPEQVSELRGLCETLLVGFDPPSDGCCESLLPE